jgi:hypothetical protein
VIRLLISTRRFGATSLKIVTANILIHCTSRKMLHALDYVNCPPFIIDTFSLIYSYAFAPRGYCLSLISSVSSRPMPTELQAARVAQDSCPKASPWAIGSDVGVFQYVMFSFRFLTSGSYHNHYRALSHIILMLYT